MSEQFPPKLLVRLSLLAVGAVLLQITAVSQITVLRATADILPLVVAAVGLLLGSMPGAAFGFALGLFTDTASYEILGVSSLIYIGACFAAGRVRELRDPQAPSTPIVAGALVTAGVILASGVVQFLLGMGFPMSWALLREIASMIVLNSLVAIPVFGFVRRILSPVIPDDPRRRRRRSYTTGGLSPLTRT